MLDSLDTLIAFVLIMLVVSMLITTCVQMASAYANLRGKYLGKGLSHTFNTILPGLGTRAEMIACQLLSGRLLSDSMPVPSAPGAQGAAKEVEANFRRCATAVRPDEVFDALHRIATGREVRLSDLRGDARDLLKGLGVSEAILARGETEVAAATGKTPEQLANIASEISADVRAIIAGLPESERAKIEATISNITSKLALQERAGVQRIAGGADEVEESLKKARKKFQYWFEVSQERAQQWFTTHMRALTVLFAVLFAFGLQLDTVEIFSLVSANRTVRDKLVAQVSSVTGQAERIIGDGGSVLREALDKWRSALTDEPAKGAVAPIDISPAETRGSLRTKIETALGQNPEKPNLLQDFDAAVDETARAKLDRAAENYSALKSSLDDTGFRLFVNDWKGRWRHGWIKDLLPHLFGMLFSVALLSLGAPFWFNALKSLTNLRSRVAENITTEQKGEKPPPGAAPMKPNPAVVSTAQASTPA